MLNLNKKIQFNKKGFSLIELLVVIILIAIISIVAFINFGDNAWKARNSMRMDTLAKASIAVASYVAQGFGQPDCSGSGTIIGFSDLNSNGIADSNEPIISKTCFLDPNFLAANKLQTTILQGGALQDPKTSALYEYAVDNNGTIGSPQVGQNFQFKANLETSAAGWTQPYYAGNYASILVPIN